MYRRRRLRSRFRVQGSGCRVQGSGFRVQGSGFRAQGSGLRVQGSGFRAQGSGLPPVPPPPPPSSPPNYQSGCLYRNEIHYTHALLLPGKAFALSFNLTQHILTHTGERPHQRGSSPASAPIPYVLRCVCMHAVSRPSLAPLPRARHPSETGIDTDVFKCYQQHLSTGLQLVLGPVLARSRLERRPLLHDAPLILCADRWLAPGWSHSRPFCE
jgi:hypothetical protein